MITINASWFGLILLCFISHFFQKAERKDLKKASRSKFCNIIFLFLLKIGEIKDFKKASWSKFCNIIFLFLLKIGSVGPIKLE